MLLTKPFEFLSRRVRRQKPRCRRQRNSGYQSTIAAECLEHRVLLSASPQLLLDINPGPVSSRPSVTVNGTGAYEFTDVGGVVFFAADDGIHGHELWKTDGTAAGTEMVKDITPAGGAIHGEGDSWLSKFTDVNGTAFFIVQGGISKKNELWKSDGTAAGTSLVKVMETGSSSFPTLANPRLTAVDGTLFFYQGNSLSGIELWKSDGSIAGTVKVTDIAPGNQSVSINGLTDFNGTLYFTANDDSHGRELWKSDGTAAGTVMVADVNPGSNDGIPTGSVLTEHAGELFFVGTTATGRALFRSDGTATGTVLIKTIGSISSGFTEVGSSLYFVANDGVHGSGLWKSDGTAAGTTMVKDIAPGTSSAVIRSLTDVDGTLFFTADDGSHGRELWKSDGTADGTKLVKDIHLGGPSNPSNLVASGGRLVFAATDETAGRELWISDGSTTVRVKDIWGGGGLSSTPSELVEVDGLVYFSAVDGNDSSSHGREPWTLDAANVSIQQVTIDIKLGSETNPVNLASNGMIAVSVFTTDDFDATLIDASSVLFAGATAVQSAFEDVDGDGDLDMILHFDIADTVLHDLYQQLLLGDLDADGVLDSTNQEAEVSLSGQTTDNVLIDGVDTLDLSLRGRALRDLLDELFAEPDPGDGS